jgi:carbon-monoxide dehydrogenase medium subunit
MVSAPFDYAVANSFERAVELLGEYGEDAKILAGGQSLGPMLNLRLARPSVLIDINSVPTPEPRVSDGWLRLPATIRHRSLITHPLVRTNSPLLATVAEYIGNVRVRNRGTFGGSLAHCDPTAELGIASLVLGAEITALGPEGTRTVPASEMFVTYLTTALEPTEVITEIAIPVHAPRMGWAFHEMVRRASDFAIVAVGAHVELAEQGERAKSVRIGLAGVSDRVVLASPDTVGPLLAADGAKAADRLVDGVAEQVAQGVEPDSDVHASGAYRRRLVRVLTARALRDAFASARGVRA